MRSPLSLHHPLHVLFLLCIVAMGLASLGAWNYGISWDEKAFILLGRFTYDHVFSGAPYPTHPGIRFHGPVFEFLLYSAHSLLGLEYAKAIFYVRRLLTFAVFIGGGVSLWWISVQTYRDRWFALLPVLFLFLSPRIVGHAFFNSRDVPSMAIFVLGIATLIWALEQGSLRRFAVCGAVTGIALSLRMSAVFLPLLVTIVHLPLAASALRPHGSWERRTLFARAGVYGVSGYLAMLASWPLLWEAPVRNFILAFQNMLSAQNQPGGFYLGERISELPWHWIPVWLVVTTPLVYTALFLVGLIPALRPFRHPMQALRERPAEVLVVLWLIVPLLLIIGMKATLFDEWRHVYFLYPPFLLIAALGARSLWQLPLPSWGALGLKLVRLPLYMFLLVSGSWSFLWMVRNHPLQYVYFSIPSRFVEHQFELDYWGVSFAQAYRFLTVHDATPLFTVYPMASPGWENINALTPAQRERIVIVGDRQYAKYIVDNFRSNTYKHTLPPEDLIHSITVSGIPVLGVYRNPAWDPSILPRLRLMEPYHLQLWVSPDFYPQ